MVNDDCRIDTTKWVYIRVFPKLDKVGKLAKKAYTEEEQNKFSQELVWKQKQWRLNPGLLDHHINALLSELSQHLVVSLNL